MNTRIIVDSTADLLPQQKERVHVVPLTVHFGDTEYIDGITIDHTTFYEKLIETDVLPSTSQATPAAFAEEFEKAQQAGEAAVVITLSSKLSGTYQSAMIAAQDYENIFVVVVAVVVMLSIKWVGILLINSLLILPAASSRNVTKNSRQYLAVSVLISLFSALSGLLISFYADTSAGATIVTVSAIVFFVTYIISKKK